jgi:sirohydrochlorin cobaltochelatase
MSHKTGLILFAHGARDPLWARPFEQIARTVSQAQPELPLSLAYLEFMQPTLAQAAQDLVAQGCTHLQVLPLFLGAGGHVRRDLPVLIAEVEQAHGVIVQLHPTIGESDAVVQAIAQHAMTQSL